MACPQPLPEPTAEARLLLTEFVQSDKVAVVAMESCEFCWTIFKLLKAIGVDYSALNFDALEYAPNNLGNEIRASAQEHTGAVTFPQTPCEAHSGETILSTLGSMLPGAPVGRRSATLGLQVQGKDQGGVWYNATVKEVAPDNSKVCSRSPASDEHTTGGTP